MTTFTFRRSYEWSKFGESSNGQLPIAAIVDGERIPLDMDAIHIASWNQDAEKPNMGAGVRAYQKHWGDDDFSKSSGRSGTIIEIEAPEGAEFEFGDNCRNCGAIVPVGDEHECIDLDMNA